MIATDAFNSNKTEYEIKTKLYQLKNDQTIFRWYNK